MRHPRYWLAGTLVAGCLAVSVNAQVVSQVVNTVAVGNITGLGANVAAMFGIAVGSAGGPVTNGGALGTPSSGTATNLSGTAASLTSGNVTTNANLTGAVTSVGNATTMNSASTALTDVTAATTWTAADASGQSLAFTSITGNFSKGNKTCVGTLRLTYPVTANGSAAAVTLPCTVANNGLVSIGQCWTTAGTPNGTLIMTGTANAATAGFINLAGNSLSPTNANLSTAVVSCSFAFITT